MIKPNTFCPESEWQFLSPGWTFSCDDKEEIFEWRLKDSGPEALRLCYANGVFQIKANQGWAFVQEEFIGHIEMHLWAKTFGASLSDPRHDAIQVEVDTNAEGKGFQLETLVSSITQNIVITTLFYEINQRLRNA